MEHSCHHCNASVEDGVPFCPKCGAPQIRVAGDDDPVTPPFPPGTPGELQTPASPVYSSSANWGSTQGLPQPALLWKIALPGAAIAGIVAGFMMLLPYVSILFFVWMFLAGGAAALAYRNRTGSPISAGIGAKVGAVTGIFAFVVTGFFYLAGWLLHPGEVRDQLKQGMELSSHPADPAQAKAMQDMVARMTSPEGMPIFLGIVLIVLFGFLVVLCAAGGAAGSTIGRKNRVL